MKRLLAMAGICLVATWPAAGQISYKMVDKHEQLKRQSLKEASQAEASSTYKDTHLNMEAYTFRKGESGKTEGRSRAKLLRRVNAPDKDSGQRAATAREKKFWLFRKKNK